MRRFSNARGHDSPAVSEMYDYDPRTRRFIMVRDNDVPHSVRVVFNWRELMR